MKTSNIAVALGLAASIAGMPSHAEGQRKGVRSGHHSTSGMQVVATSATSGQPGDGWQYFSNDRDGHAVVISPTGEYFHSRGKGLKLVFKSTGAA